MRRFVLVYIIAALLPVWGRTQETEQTDSLVRLLSAVRMEQVDRNGQNYRKVTGPARFLHNNTYLICDTAFWNMNTSVIECIDNVSIVQEGTRLTSDKLIYLVDEDLAQFRGSLVQLEDKEGNLLRTRHLDYNTKDSVAVFTYGGAMRDKDGQLIESIDGSYDSKIKLFRFTRNVNMFTDSVFVKTSSLDYHSDTGVAVFGAGTDAWKEDNMLSSDSGWYDRARELFLFTGNVHGMNDAKEMWSDSLYYNRLASEVELLGNAQVSDTTRNAHALAGRMVYTDSLSLLTMTRNPVIVGIQQTEDKADTVYARADRFTYWTTPMCDIDSSAIWASRARLADLSVDAIAQYRQKAAADARKAAEEALKNDPNAANSKPKKGGGSEQSATPVESPSGGSGLDAGSLEYTLQADSLFTSSDSTVVTPLPPKDSTKIGFLKAFGRFKLFKSDLQMVSDSLEYTDLDSLVRLYKFPLVWNGASQQYTSDSLFTVIRNGSVDKASLMSDAFVIIQEDSLCFDQIRSTEMMAYFDHTGSIRRFDAMGDADAIFYIQEDSTYATVNFSKSKILSASFRDGGIEQVYYFDEAKSDAYPVAQIKPEDRELKGFSWSPDQRPASKSDITDKNLHPTERAAYASRPRALFRETERYFPGYISKVYKDLEQARMERSRLREQREAERQAVRDSLALADSIDKALSSVADSIVIEEVSVLDSTDVRTPLDSTMVQSLPDSLDYAPAVLTAKELKRQESARRKAEKQRLRMERQAAREKEWARLDSLDAVRTAEKAAARLEKERRKKLKALEKLRRQEAEDKALLDKYIEYYRRRKAKEDASK